MVRDFREEEEEEVDGGVGKDGLLELDATDWDAGGILRWGWYL